MLPSQIEDGIIVDVAFTPGHRNVSGIWSNNSRCLMISELRNKHYALNSKVKVLLMIRAMIY